MIIDQLPLLASDVQDTDEFPIERGTTTYKTTKAALVKSAADAAAAAQSTADGAQSAAEAAQQSANVALTRSVPSGGTTGQVLAKASNTSYNTQWIDPPDPSGFVSYAEAQTLTDAQQKQARENIGADWEILWQNASPGNDFAAQTVSIDLSSWSVIAVDFYRATVAQQEIWTFCDVGKSGWSDHVGAASGNFSARTRVYSVTASGITFEDCINNGSTTVNNFNIPFRVYGVLKA